MSEPDMHRGARIGTRVAHIVSQAIVYTHNKLLDTKHKLAVMVFNTISNEISDEVDTTIGPILKKMAAAYDEGGHAAGMLAFMAHGRGQFKAIVGSSSTAQSLTWALGTIISNELAPMSYGAIASNPHLIPDAGTIAQMAAGRHYDYGSALVDIRANGYKEEYGNAMIRANMQWPDSSQLSDWMLKGVIDRNYFKDRAEKSGMDDLDIKSAMEAAFTPTSMPDAALAFLRGALPREELYKIAMQTGCRPYDVDIYLDTIGEPPGTMEMLEGYRRGFISQSELQRGIKQSRTRDEWIPLIEKLRYSPMSVAEAVDAAVQNHISEDAARSIADQNGLEPGQYDILYQTAGSPLSRTELNELYNRGLIGSDVVKQGLAESRMKDKYTADAFALRRRLLEPRTLSSMVHNGAMSHETAIRKAMESGYNAEDAGYLIAAASNMKMQAYREKVMEDVENLYADGGCPPETVVQTALSMGHSPDEAQLISQHAEYKRDQRAFTTATSAIRSRFVGHHIDKAQASNMLDSIGMIANQRDFLLRFWQLEASANVRSLTEPQIIKAFKDGIFTAEYTLSRLRGLGYTETDANVLVEMAG